MSFIDKSETNVKRHVMKEVAATSAAGGFVGGAGMSIDSLFAGPYHPKYSELDKLLKQQIKDRKEKIKDTDSLESNPVGGYYETDTEQIQLAYDELLTKIEIDNKYNMENTPPPDTEWKSTGWDYKYDDNEPYIEKDNFINKSKKNMETVGVDIKYDKNESLYNKEDFINKSKKNWKYINNRG